MDKAPEKIGIFDSGVGGLTVLRSLAEKFPHENYIYLGDTARLPYGSKSPGTIKKYCEQNMQWLRQQGVQTIIIACNSASAHWQEPGWQGLTVYNVIDPGVSAALAATRNHRIGVLGTRATIQSNAYGERLQKARPETQVYSQSCPLFVPLVEEGWIDDPLTNLVSYRYINPLIQNQIDTLILGCTHYPALKDSIQRVTGHNVTLIDSGAALAEQMSPHFQAKNKGPLNIQLNFTDLSPHLAGLSEKLLSGLPIQDIQKIDLV